MSCIPSLKIEIDGDLGYKRAIERILFHILPPHCFEENPSDFHFAKVLPALCWTPLGEPPFDISFFMWCRFREGAFQFFYQMLSRWLLPNKKLNALMQFAIDFSLPEVGPEKYIVGEVRVRIESQPDFKALQKNLPILETEIRIGLESGYHASCILESKGMNLDEKTALIQENMVSLIKYRPQDFDYDLLTHMQQFVVLCREEFKMGRSPRHMSRILCVHYLFRKALKFSSEIYPERRYINIKLIRGVLPGKRRVLGIAIGMSFLRDHERFDASHILSGVQALLPQALFVEGSFFSKIDKTLIAYLEIEKVGGISFDEEKVLKERLASELKNRIEQLHHPLFMPQNEEVVMRHVVTLGSELKDPQDLPQAILDFSKQTEDKLEFLSVFLRVAKPKLASIDSFFESMPTILEYLPDRVKKLGLVQKKYPKEASIFRLRIPKAPFLRCDHSVDLTKARQTVAEELKRLIGDYRDYNGGTLSKEAEIFEKLKIELGDKASEQSFLLENFFYSLQPPMMRSIFPSNPLVVLFEMILEGEKESLGELPFQMRIHYDESYFYTVIIARDPHFHSAIEPILRPYRGKIVTCFLQEAMHPSFGLIFRGPEKQEVLSLRYTLEQTITTFYV